ncbi:hypothetical protein JVU11DRAFT_6186 [Chiua virens]|nr:hypothetical protein JVU11DRAFT_6186 [Chiua virens]
MDPNHKTPSNDLLHVMECKILRRLSKLGESTPNWLSEMAMKACARLRQILDARWEQPNASPSFRNPSQDELARDSRVSFLNSAEYIRNALSNPSYKSVGTPFHPNQRCRRTIDDFLSSDGTFFEESYRADPDVTLFDVERLVQQGIDDWVTRVTNVGEACSQLEILMDKYAQLSMSSRNRGSERDLKWLLTGIELFLALDKLVIREIPLLADYSPAIPIAFLEAFFLRTTTSLHRLSHAYQYFSARHSSSRSGWSVFSNEFTEESLPVRYYDQSTHLQHLKAQIEGNAMHTAIGHTHHEDGNKHSRSPLPVSPLQAKVVVFELQCPAHIRIWRSAAFRVLYWFVHLMPGHTWTTEERENLLARSIELQPYFSGHDGPPLHCQIHFSYFYPRGSQSRNSPTLRYVLQREISSIGSQFIVCKSGLDTFGREDRPFRFHFRYGGLLGRDDSLSNHIYDTSCTPNNVLAAQVHCPTDFSVEEFTAFAQLRSGGSLQWLNILHGLRSRTLNLRRLEVHFLLSRAVFQVGPLDLNTGVWIWHQELENVSFCNALMDELYALFVDFGVESMDAIVMGNMALLLTRILASSPSERVSERAIHLLRDIRSKTLLWVEELSYNLAMAPTNTKRSRLLLEMAATCRSTFDVDPACLPKLFRSAEDVDATLSCALFIRSLRPDELEDIDDKYSRLLLLRDLPLSLALEGMLSDVILADPSEYGIDLAVHKLLGRYQPCTSKWEQLGPPNDRWLSCKIELTMEPPQVVHLDLLTGALRADGKPLTGLPLAIRDIPECKEIFRDQGFIVIPSNLPGMDFMTHTTSSKHRVHYSLRDDDLVVQVQCNGTRDILELIPSYIFWKDLPTALVDGHIHWLNLSSRIIEIRPFEHLWEESSENWRIDCTNDQYRIYKGREILVDTRSPTWSMVSRCFDPLNNLMGLRGKSRNLLITTTPTNSLPSLPVPQLSVVLPHYGLSFFVNAQGELESRDFRDMVYDDNQSIGALFGLDNLLVLRPKLVIAGTLLPEALIPRRILVPDGFPTQYGVHRVRVKPSASRTLVGLFCHVYDVDPELGCLIGNGSLTSTQYLAVLHAATSCDRPDPLTSKTGAQVAHGLLRCGGCHSVMRLRHLDGDKFPTSSIDDYPQINTQYPQLAIMHHEILLRYYWTGTGNHVSPSLKRSVQRAAHLFLSKVTGPNHQEDCDDADYSEIDTGLELQDLVSTAASVIYTWSVGAPTITPLINWQQLWHANDREKIFLDTTFRPRYTVTVHSDSGLVQRLITKVQDILETSKEAHPRFQLLFLLPTTAYCSPCYPVAFLSMLIAFANLSPPCLRNLPVHTDCDLLDGWRPTERILYNLVNDPAWLATKGELFVAAMDLLKGWPRETPPISLDPRTYNVKEKTLAKNLMDILAESRSGSILQVAPRPISSLQNMPHDSECTRWQVTLEQLLADRLPPTLPSRNPLPCDSHRYKPEGNERLANDVLKLESQIFSSVLTDHPFQQEYLTYLHASSQRICDEYLVTRSRTAGGGLIEAFRNHYVLCKANYMRGLAALKQALVPPTDPLAQALDRSGQWPQIGAIDLLQCVASTSPINIPPCWKKCLILFALLLLDLQHSRRLLRLALYGLEEELAKELENAPCDGWKPEEYPDWLLIQIQGNFTIRRAQAKTAMEIMSPQSGENTVMQVNMGEGKSSVIIPIAAAALADGKQLVRIVVPRALTVQMFDILVSRLGGLANRPIYHLPFSRNLEYDEFDRVISLQVDDLQKLMSRCMAEHGILLLQPEHVVSLRLMSMEEQIRKGKVAAEQVVPKNQSWIYKCLETCLSLKSLTEDTFVGNIFRQSNKLQHCSTDDDSDRSNCGDLDTASKWLRLQKWIHIHCRDILDESDEILHTRFQLIYTIGPQQHMDGYPHRWTIMQQVLQLVKEHAYSLSMYSPLAVEYEGGPQASFPYIHIVRASDIGRSLVSFIAKDVMAGRIPALNFQHVSPPLHDAIHSFIFDDVLRLPDTAEKVEEYAKNSHQSYLWSGLLLLRGLLASNILVFALSEWKWRVNYGLQVHPSDDDWDHSRLKASTMLAVPYRAKDTPAPNTQFGHPDITIILTCLSYYYTGLNEDQLRASFEILLDEDDSSTEYARWVKGYTGMLPKSLQELGEINLRSSEQWDKVTFPLFTRNQATIDFYLSRVVFPKEAKEFPWKLAGSSWDLAEKREKLITGFSGTNDNRWLLPTSIAQHDLEHQKGTNARILGYLLRPENDFYEVTYESGGRRSTREFLRTVVNHEYEIRVLLDVGAQILDLSNQEVARAWLDIAQHISGAIYFNEKDELMVLTQEGTTLPLLSSPLSETLERCVVYLDHAHTRGTDLKFPNGSRAAVTLGPKVTKDNLVQGCMRMRKLGHGHSVMFFAPPDVDRTIRAVTGKKDLTIQVTTADVLCWTIHETWVDVQQWTPHWAQQGMIHKSRYETWTRFSDGDLTRDALSNAWLQPEGKSLAELYGPSNTESSSSTLSALDPGIRQRCEALGVLSFPSAQLDEEQEREVNREREREREVELPSKAEPAEHSVHPDVETFVETGIIPPLHSGSAFQPVFTSLKKSTAATRDADVWSSFILATTDFCRTIKPESTHGTMDRYLRPVQWVLTSKRADNQVLVLVSPFEVHTLLPDIRVSECVHLHLYAPRTSQRVKPSDDLKLYTIPPLPSDSWTPPWNLIDQLNVFSGQLYLRDYQSYLRLCRFLGVPAKDSPNDITPRWNLFNIPGSFEENEIRFSDSPLPSVMALLGIRSKGRPFAHTHMGRILQGQVLMEKDFEGSTSIQVVSRRENAAAATTDQRSQQTPYDVPSEAIRPSSSDMECNNTGDARAGSSVFPSSTGKRKLGATEPDDSNAGTEPLQKRPRAH